MASDGRPGPEPARAFDDPIYLLAKKLTRLRLEMLDVREALRHGDVVLAQHLIERSLDRTKLEGVDA